MSRALFFTAVALLLIGEFIALTGIVAPVLSPLTALFSFAYISNAFISSAWAGVFIVHLAARKESRSTVVLILGIAAAVAAVLYGHEPFQTQVRSGPWFVLPMALSGSVGVASLLVQVASIVSARGQDKQRTELFFLSFSLPLFITCTPFYLNLTAALRPGTWDVYLRGFDQALGIHALEAIPAAFSKVPLLVEVSSIVYLAVPLLFALGAFVASRQGQRQGLQLWGLFLFATLAGYAVYFMFPACGPRYLAQVYPTALSELRTVVLPAYPRNCVPSLHMTWTVLLWWNMRSHGVLHASWSLACAILTLVFMLGSGEHYLVDVILSVPFIIAVQMLFTAMTRPAGSEALVRSGIAASVLFLLFLLLLRVGAELWLLPGVAFAATALMLALSAWLVRAVRGVDPAVLERRASAAPAAPGTRVYPYYFLFIASGFAALVYEVTFAKALALTFGGTALATYTVLMTYMGGLAIGAWLGGILAERTRHPLKAYAMVELAIGIYCGATIWLTPAIRQLYVYLASDVDPSAMGLNVLRVSLGALLLGIPTFLMGITLPLMTRHIHATEGIGRSISGLYSANTAGAALGALFAGYVLIPALGMKSNLGLAVVINLLVAAVAIRIWKRSASSGLTNMAASSTDLLLPRDRSLRGVALAVLIVGGITTLALEVTFMHLLAIVAGNSVYAFSLMLFAFLLGLCGGAAVTRQLLARSLERARWLYIAQCALGFWIVLTLLYWDSLPAYFASFHESPFARTFAARELVRAVVCLLAMLPPALLIGSVYPIAMQYVAAGGAEHKIKWVGRAASLNTVGNITGVALAAFVLIPTIGAYRTAMVLGAVSVLLGVAVAWRLRLRAQAVGTLLVFGVLLGLLPRGFDYTALSSGANVYFHAQHYGAVVDHVESSDGGLTSIATSKDADGTVVKTLLTNGKFQGDNSVNREMAAQFGFALTPLLHTPHRTNALVIGYGTGVSARALSDAGFQNLDIVELSSDIFQMADRHFADANGAVRERPGTRSYVTDGRNFLLLQNRQYDLISMEVSSIWFAGAASLYNREFYQLAKKRLTDRGILQQWVQLHRLAPLDIVYILGTLRSEFHYVSLYFVGSQGIIVASNATMPPSEETLSALETNVEVTRMVAAMRSTPRRLLENLVLSPFQVDTLLTKFQEMGVNWISTDDNLHLEYSTPKGNVRMYGPSLNANLEFLRSASAVPPRRDSP